ncbi:MAG: hypothetical protein HYY23_21210 [Verrucomicrobia bacterium]|nr:hypothetical protein [Verrucomicrobiota bacterium]
MNALDRRSNRRQQIALVTSALFSAGLISWPALAADPGAPTAAAGDKAPALEKKSDDSTTEYRNWFDVSVGGVLLQGDKAAYQRRYRLPGSAFGGVESFHYEQDVGKKGLFSIDGRGIFDTDDYALKLELSNPDIGYLRAGYKEFRSWYDGSGGYFPRNGQWFSLSDEELSLDRGEAWFEGGLTLPDRPELTFRYSHQFRDGRKDSTIWGDSNLTGGFGARGIVPAFRDMDEERDIFAADVKHKLGNTDLGVGLRYEFSKNDNSLNIRRRPNEPAADRVLTQREGVDTDMFNAHAFTETRLNEKVLVTTGYSFTTLDTDISGSRIYGADYDPIYDPLFARRQQRDEGFFGLTGGAQIKQHVGNFNLMLTPWSGWAIVPSLRVERQDQSGVAEFVETNVGAGPAFAAAAEDLLNLRERGFLDVSQSLEARYAGITNWTFYARAELLEGEGDLMERELEATTGVVDLVRDTDSTRFTQKYVAGANWYPHRRLNLGAQYYHKIRENSYDHVADTTSNVPPSSNRYPAFFRDQNFETDDANVRVTLRPLDSVTLISRYDFQLSTIETIGDYLDPVRSAEARSHILSQSMTWTPLARLFLQGSLNYVWDKTESPTAQSVPGTNLVLNVDNSYWNASATAGYALTDKTDLQAQYFYYRADNFEDNSQFSQPYGVGAEEHGVTAAIIHRIRKNLVSTVKYGYFRNEDETSGGHNNYEAHLVYSSLRYSF